MDAIRPVNFRKDQLPHTIPNMPLVRRANAQATISTWLSAIGGIVLLIGIVMLIFGPDSIMVGPGGPTIKERLLLLPGPITSLGVLLLVLAPIIKIQGVSSLDHYVATNYQLVDKQGNISVEGFIRGVDNGYGELKLYFVPLFAPTYN